MKQPIDPDIFRARQERNGDVIQLVASLLGLVAIAAILFGVIWFAWGNTDLMFAVAVVGVVFAFIPATGCVVGVVESASSIIWNRQYISRKINEQAWNAQQEELARLRTIMKEEDL